MGIQNVIWATLESVMVGNEMDIAKQIVDQRIDSLMKENESFFSEDDPERRKSKFFLLMGVASYLDMDISEAYSCVTDGGNDGGFDAAYIEESNEGQVNVVLFQSKYTRDLNKNSSFPANAVEKAVNTIKTVFDPSTVAMLNEISKKKVDEIRSLILDGYVPYVTFVMLNNGVTWNKDAQNYIDNAFGGQEQVRFEHYSHEDILGYIERVKPIDTQIMFAGKAIQEDFNFKRVLVGKLNISEIYNLLYSYGDRLLERNIRRFLGKSDINDNISMCLKGENRANFFFYNNGITMICDKFSYNALQEKDWIVKVNGLQIINGGQTCKTIYQTLSEQPDLETDDVYVPVRVYEVSDEEDIVNEITFATNHQNPVDLRDLKSNDEYQKRLEQSVKDLGYTYKRKRDNMSSASTIPSTVAAEAVFAIWRKKPHLAKYKKGDLFGIYYDDIFKNLNAAQLVLAVLIFRLCDTNRKKTSDDKDIKAIRPYSNYFVACIVGERLLKDNHMDDYSELTHQNFDQIIDYFNRNRDLLLSWAERKIVEIVRDYYNLEKSNSLEDVDGRTMAAAFRRFDIVEKYIKKEEWWEKNMDVCA